MIVEEEIVRKIPPEPEDLYVNAIDLYRESKRMPTVESNEDTGRFFVLLQAYMYHGTKIHQVLVSTSTEQVAVLSSNCSCLWPNSHRRSKTKASSVFAATECFCGEKCEFCIQLMAPEQTMIITSTISSGQNILQVEVLIYLNFLEK